MTILITGATGLIGSLLRSKLIESGEIVYCQSRLKHNDTQTEKWIQFDLSNFDEINFQKFPEFDTVFHLASQTSLGYARENPISDLTTNVSGFLALLNQLKKQSKKANVILAGTTTQVGLYNGNIITEELPDQPESFYDLSKLTAERYLKQFIKEDWVKGCSLRLANVFGATSNSQMTDRGIIDKIFNRALNGEEISVFGNGEFLRDYIHIEDVVSAFIEANLKSNVLNGGHFIIASGISLSLEKAFETAVKLAGTLNGKFSKIVKKEIPKSMSPIELRSVKYDISKFKNLTNWVPKFDLESGLRYSYKGNIL